jgi:sulfate transport system permease protein
MGWDEFIAIVGSERTLHALWLSFGAAFAAAIIDAVFGFLVAWVLVRYRFPGRKIIDAIIDLPFALPTAVAGIALVAIYSKNGPFGQYLEPLGIKAAYTPLGIIIAMTFIGLPFVVRSVQPVLEQLDQRLEEAAASLGASRGFTFRMVIFPAVLPALLTGFALALALALARGIASEPSFRLAQTCPRRQAGSSGNKGFTRRCRLSVCGTRCGTSIGCPDLCQGD